MVLAAVIAGIFALTAAGITAYATTRQHTDDSRAPSPSPTASAPPATGAGAGPTEANASPSATSVWKWLVDEDMREGGIDMDSWPEFLAGDVDVGPHRITGNPILSDFETSNGATIVHYGINQPSPMQCSDHLGTSGAVGAKIEDGAFYCVKTSEGELLLFQVKSISDDAVSLRGYGVEAQAA